ncbi:MAG: hypothetical protein KatS3mg119_1703 [Rhodothalassiaceae bacterium]|nr:MAG: hypothetical protein KatS3mg119_1703 [Rhodothalassiaceae bacterium]
MSVRPAMRAPIAVALFALVVAGTPVGAARAQAVPGDVVAGMKACLAVRKKSERLRCFETLAQETVARAEGGRGAAGAPPAAGAAASAPAGAAADGRGDAREAGVSEKERVRPDYGLKRKEARKEPKTLDVVITAAWPDRRGRWHFETADGQVWRQKDEVRVRLTKLPVNARLEKGLIGGYFLDIEGVPSDIRVERLR